MSLFSLVPIILLLPSSYRWLLTNMKDNYYGIIPVTILSNISNTEFVLVDFFKAIQMLLLSSMLTESV